MDAATRQSILESAGVEFAPGLSASEINAAENQYGFIFPPDLAEFLAHALPVSKGWIDWRNDNEAEIWDSLQWPYEGMCFDIEHAEFWLEEWGDKPAPLEQRFVVAKRAIDQAPTLVPVCGHRYMPDRPSLPGNPVFSVWQTDIIYYGIDLQNYLENEYHDYFETPAYNVLEHDPIRIIEFWSGLT
jgi:hypothetical protein